MSNKQQHRFTSYGRAIVIPILVIAGGYLVRRLIDFLWQDPKEKHRHNNRVKEENLRHRNRCDEDEHRHDLRMDEIRARQVKDDSEEDMEDPLREEESFSSAVNYEESTQHELLAGLFRQGERVVFFSRTGQGKSTLVTQIAITIATGGQSTIVPSSRITCLPQSVVLYDAEQDYDDIHDRYGRHGFEFPDRLRRISDCYFDSAQALGSDIARRSEKFSSDTVIVVDNITAICPTFVAEKARDFFRILKKVQIQAHARNVVISFVLVGHTTKDFSDGPIELKHLAGSANIVNFATSVFALSATRFGESIKMLKTLKSRKCPKEGKVSILQLDDNQYLHFVYLREDNEADALPVLKKGQNQTCGDTTVEFEFAKSQISWEDKVEMWRLNKEQHMSYRTIAPRYKVSHKTVGEYIKEVEAQIASPQ